MRDLLLLFVLNFNIPCDPVKSLGLVVRLNLLYALCRFEQRVVILLELHYKVVKIRYLNWEPIPIVALLVSQVIYFLWRIQKLRDTVACHELQARGACLCGLTLTPNVREIGRHGLDHSYAEVAREELSDHIYCIYEGPRHRARHVHHGDPLGLASTHVVSQHHLVARVISRFLGTCVESTVRIHFRLPAQICIVSQSWMCSHK